VKGFLGRTKPYTRSQVRVVWICLNKNYQKRRNRRIGWACGIEFTR